MREKLIYVIIFLLGKCPMSGEYRRSFFFKIGTFSLLLLYLILSWKQFSNYLGRINQTWTSCLRGLLWNQPSMYLYRDPVLCWWTACNIEGNNLTFMQYKSNRSNRYFFGCPSQTITSQTLGVQINQTVNRQAQYTPPSTSGTFYHCGNSPKW